jgi:hypothetical protein
MRDSYITYDTVAAHDTKHADFLWERDGSVKIALNNGFGNAIFEYLCRRLGGSIRVTLTETYFLVEDPSSFP